MYSLSKARILHFDLENRPLSYWCDDRPSAEVTAIAWSWADEKEIMCWLQGKNCSRGDSVLEFMAAYRHADIVTGHYIRKHDLPLLNGMLMENVPPHNGLRHHPKLMLTQKLASDTKLDLVKRLDLPASQEALSAYLGVKAPKIHMTQADWRDANRLTDTGLARTYKRVVGDIKQHKQMRAALLKRGLLRGPRMWTP